MTIECILIRLFGCKCVEDDARGPALAHTVHNSKCMIALNIIGALKEHAPNPDSNNKFEIFRDCARRNNSIGVKTIWIRNGTTQEYILFHC